jgi:hypothetical protein
MNIAVPLEENPSFQEILLLIGQLNYTWTNTESLLLHLIAGLAQVDKETAVIIFLTLNTTRARLDLVERLAKASKTSAECRKDVLSITEQIGKESKIRNKYNHCIYSFDERGQNAKTILMRIHDEKNSIVYGKTEAIDFQEKINVKKSIEKIKAINSKIWELIRKYNFPI